MISSETISSARQQRWASMLCNCEIQFNVALGKSGRSHNATRLSQIGTKISKRSRQRRPQNFMCAGQRVKLVDDLSKRSFSLFIGRPCCQYGGQ